MIDNTLIPPTPEKPLFITLTKIEDGGTIPNHPIYDGYHTKGWITSLPEVGRSIVMLRVESNGRKALGQFYTSSVTSVKGLTREGCTITTRNSTYEVRFYPEEEFALDTLLELS